MCGVCMLLLLLLAYQRNPYLHVLLFLFPWWRCRARDLVSNQVQLSRAGYQAQLFVCAAATLAINLQTAMLLSTACDMKHCYATSHGCHLNAVITGYLLGM
jgi:hypothetical protein